MNEGRDDEAWDFAVEHPDAARAASRWPELCARRANRHPAETLPVYRRLITETLEVTDKRNYMQAANLLIAMRRAAESAGEPTGSRRSVQRSLRRTGPDRPASRS